ncbi:MAG: glycosyltransferase [Planktomarina sp.]|nr:glycosyltransferase [Planktomarina sp.]
MSSRKAPIALSIIIPTKDRPKLLDAAVRSALETIPKRNAEVIIVDDRSHPPVLETLQISDKRLRVIVNEAPAGASGARNFGVLHALGQRVLFLDDDDLMLSGYPEWVCEQDGDYGHSSILKFKGFNSPNDMPRFSGGIGQDLEGIRPFPRQAAGLGCGFWVDRSVFLDVGGIAEDIRVNEDTDFSIKLLKSPFKGIKAPHAGVMVRQHGGRGDTIPHLTQMASAAERADYFNTILTRHADWIATRPDATTFLLQRQLKMLAKAGNSNAAYQILASHLAKPYRTALTIYYAAEYLVARFKSLKS